MKLLNLVLFEGLEHQTLSDELKFHVESAPQVKKKKIVEAAASTGQTSMRMFTVKQAKKSQLTQDQFEKALVKFVGTGIHPFSIVETGAFKDFIATCLPDVRLMDRKEVSRRVLIEAEKVRQLVKTKLASADYVSTAVDCWTARNRSYIGITCHWIGMDFQRESAILACRRLKGKHTFDRLASAMEDVSQEFGIEAKTTGTVTDNGSNFCKAFREFATRTVFEEEEEDEVDFVDCGSLLEVASESNYRLPPHYRCAAHTLNLVAAKDTNNAKSDRKFAELHESTFAKLKEVCQKQSRSPQMAETIKEVMGKKFVMPNETRWNSLYDCVQSFVKADEENKLDGVMHALHLVPFRPAEKSFLREYVRVMKPLACTLDHLQGEQDMFMGNLLPAIKILTRQLEQLQGLSHVDLPSCQPLVKAVLGGVRTRFEPLLARDEVILATSLHPRFKLTWVSGEEEEVKVRKLLKEKVGDFIICLRTEEEEDPSDFYALLNTCSSTQGSGAEILDRYLLSPVEKRVSATSVPQGLQKFFKKFNVTLPSSASVERLFSSAGQVLTPLRGGLSDDSFEAQVLLKCNQKWM